MKLRSNVARWSVWSKTRATLALCSVLALVGLAAALVSAQGPESERGEQTDVRPAGRGGGTVTYAPYGRANLPEHGILYHGGPVILGQVNVYYIWYGGWSGNSLSSAENILDNLAQNIDRRPPSYFDIETTYYQVETNVVKHVSNVVTFSNVSAFVTNYPETSSTYKKKLTDTDILDIVKEAITDTWQTPDPNGVYFVLTSADVDETSGFCTSYCRWHLSTIANGTGTINGVDVKYAFVGDAARCPSACLAMNRTISPNNNPGVDGMADGIAHELDEAVNDPDLNAWSDSKGEESADKCAFTYGTTSTASNGSRYNITLGGLQYLIQRNWVNARLGYCSMRY
jgi:hypothetical protein